MVLNIIFLYFSSLLKTHDHLKQNLLPCILGFKVYTFHFIVLTILHLADIAFFFFYKLKVCGVLCGAYLLMPFLNSISSLPVSLLGFPEGKG